MVVKDRSQAGKSRRETPNEGLTVRQAADALNVDRAYLRRIVAEGRLPVTGTGGAQRIRQEDFLAYQREQEARQARARDDLLTASMDAGLDDVDADTLATIA